jgi:Domain of unknown function (DUF5916)
LPEGKTLSGYAHNLAFSKTGGRFNFNVWQDVANSKYQQNDMGYFTNNNYIDNGFWAGYKWVKAKKWYNRLNLNFNTYYSRRLNPNDYQNFTINANFNGTLKSLWWFGVFVNYNAQENDFYEPRISNYVFKRPERAVAGFWLGSNEAKKFSSNTEISVSRSGAINATGVDVSWYNQYRFNNKLTVSLNVNNQYRKNNYGFATIDNNGTPIVGLRDRNTITNILNIKYNFSNTMGLTVRTRHYFSKVKYHQYQELQQDGAVKNTAFDYDRNTSYNILNVDLNYFWQFRLGSFLYINWKDQVEHFTNDASDGYFKNLGNTVNTPQQNSFSVRVVFFIDYLDLRKKGKS